MRTIKTFHHYFINKCVSSLIRGIADYFSTEFFDRSKEIIISTYEKALQHYMQRIKNLGEETSVEYPFLTLDPAMDFEPDPQAGRFFWEYPSFISDVNLDMYEPKIYEDENVAISVVMNRYKGRFDLVAWCSSVYELMDFRIQAIQLFGGQERYIIPRNINGYIVLPDELIGYSYEDVYSGQRYQLNWEQYGKARKMLVKNINLDKYVYTFTLRPYIKLTGAESSTDLYGGGDSLSEYRLTLSCEWECNIPTHLVLHISVSPETTMREVSGFFGNVSRLHIDMDINYAYYKINNERDFDIIVPERFHQFDEGLENENEWSNRTVEQEVVFKTRYSYILTEDDEKVIKGELQDRNYFDVSLPEEIYDPFNLIVVSKYGRMRRDFHWKVLDDDRSIVRFMAFNLKSMKAGDVIWFALFEKESQ